MTAALERLRPVAPEHADDDAVGAAPRGLSVDEMTAVVAVGIGVACLGLVGLINSFANVTAALRPAFGALAPTATLGIDLGIAVFATLGLVLAKLDMPLGWLRLVPWLLTAATIALNIAPERTWVGRLAHAVLPMLWVVAVDVGIHAVRVRTGLAAGRRMDTIRASRWLLAPVATVLLWRRMVLWEIRSYPDALAAERRRLLALTELKDSYGHLRIGHRKVRAPWAWRWTAPRRERALHRLGEHAPAATQTNTEPGSGSPAQPPASPARRTTRSARRHPTGGTTGEAIARLLAENPDLTTAALAARLQVSTRTVRRHLAAMGTTSTSKTSDRSEGEAPA